MSALQEVQADNAQPMSGAAADLAPGQLVMVYRSPVSLLDPSGPAQIAAILGTTPLVDVDGGQVIDVTLSYLLTGEVRRRLVSEPLGKCWKRWRSLDEAARGPAI